jgi:hypothetical protein
MNVEEPVNGTTVEDSELAAWCVRKTSVAVRRTGTQMQQQRVWIFCSVGECEHFDLPTKKLRLLCAESILRAIFSYSILKGSDDGVQLSGLLRF